MSQGFGGQGQWSGGPWGQPSGQPGGGFGSPAFGRTPGWSPAPAPGGFHPAGSGPMPGGQQPAGGFPGGPGPRKKRSPVPLILGALAVVGLAMVGLVLYSTFGGPRYQNDDYVPPPPGDVKPFPDAEVSEVDALLTANPLYAQKLATPIRCELSNPNMNLETASDAEVKTYIDELMACNMRVWDQPFRDTHRFELVRPVVNIYHDSVSTPCGGGERMGPNAAYCPANQQVYFSRQIQTLHPNLAIITRPHVIDEIMAHEFGHSLQGRSLILQASYYKQRQGDRAAALELNRRAEVQADCFAGMYLQAVAQSVGYTQADIDTIMESVRLGGDDNLRDRPDDPGVTGDHGHGASRLYWHQVGLTSTDIGRCNTYSAPAEYVR